MGRLRPEPGRPAVMGYPVRLRHTRVFVELLGKRQPLTLTRLPFIMPKH